MAFSGIDIVNGDSDEERPTDGTDDEWRFGGLLRGKGAVPICKHLLACVLVERCEFMGDLIEKGSVTVDELAGLAAGWGG